LNVAIRNRAGIIENSAADANISRATVAFGLPRVEVRDRSCALLATRGA
jgi:hypothetical protein